MRRIGQPWVILLAGGRGERLRDVTTSAAGQTVPKQFCRLNGRNSMLSITLERARRLTAANRILVLVLEEHRLWWETELEGLPPENVLVQSSNRGTAAALLRALFHVYDRDPDGCVVCLPSDHAVDEEDILTEAIRGAVDEAGRLTSNVILVGASALAPDASLGWIIPGGDMGFTRAVTGFVEKPDLEEAARCIRRGAFCNTLILAASTRALLMMYAISIPEWVDGAGDGAFRMRPWAFAEFRSNTPAMDFSRDVLQPSVESLRVLPLPECGWTDIGTVERLEEWWMSHPRSFAEVRQFGVFLGGPQARATA